MIVTKYVSDGGGGGYVLPAATQSTLGGIKVGAGLDIDSGGTLSVSGGTGGGGDYIVTEALSSITNPTEGMIAYVPAHMEGNTATAVTYTEEGDYYDGEYYIHVNNMDPNVPQEYKTIGYAFNYRHDSSDHYLAPQYYNGDLISIIGKPENLGKEWIGLGVCPFVKGKINDSGFTITISGGAALLDGAPDYEGFTKTVETGVGEWVPDTVWIYLGGEWRRSKLRINYDNLTEVKSELMWVTKHPEYQDSISLYFGSVRFNPSGAETDWEGNTWIHSYEAYCGGFHISFFYHPQLHVFIFQAGNTEPYIPVAQCNKFNIDVDSAGTETLYTNGISPERVYDFAHELAGYERTNSKPLYLIAGVASESWYTDSIDEMKIYRNHAQAVAAREDTIPGAMQNAVTVEGRFFNYVTEKWRKITIAAVYQNDTWEWGTPTIVDE